MARSIDAEIAIEIALPPPTSRMSQVRLAGGGLSLGGTLGTCNFGTVECGAILARELSWKGTARQYGLDWKSVAAIVKRAVAYGLRHRARPPVHVIGIDEVSRRKGQVYLTVVYDLNPDPSVAGAYHSGGLVGGANYPICNNKTP